MTILEARKQILRIRTWRTQRITGLVAKGSASEEELEVAQLEELEATIAVLEQEAAEPKLCTTKTEDE